MNSLIFVSRTQVNFISSWEQNLQNPYQNCAFFWNYCGYLVLSESHFHLVLIFTRLKRSVHNSRFRGAPIGRVCLHPYDSVLLGTDARAGALPSAPSAGVVSPALLEQVTVRPSVEYPLQSSACCTGRRITRHPKFPDSQKNSI